MSEPKKLGRPTKYDPSYVQKVQQVCLLGGTDEQIADFFEVSVSTIHNWYKEHPEFLQSIKLSKLQADVEVARTLYSKARAGDTVASIFWLKNRQPRSWRDQQNIDAKLSIEVEKPDLSAFTDQELALYEQLNTKARQSAPKQIDSAK
jgi:hypothetical protein